MSLYLCRFNFSVRAVFAVYVATLALSKATTICDISGSASDAAIDVLSSKQVPSVLTKLVAAVHTEGPPEKAFEKCLQLCCGLAECNVATLDLQHYGRRNSSDCLLVMCSPISECVWQDTIAGFVTAVLRKNMTPVRQKILQARKNRAMGKIVNRGPVQSAKHIVAPLLKTDQEKILPKHPSQLGKKFENQAAAQKASKLASETTRSRSVIGKNATLGNVAMPFHRVHDAPQPSRHQKNGLMAALTFGIIFLAMVTALVGKKFYENQQRKQYEKVDYLVNGMYKE